MTSVSLNGSVNSPETRTSNGEDTLQCGYGRCRPKYLQIFNNPKAVLFFLSCFAFTQGFIVNGVINVNISSLETRFGLSSTKAGWIASIYDISAAPLAVIFGFLGNKGHKPRLLGIGAIALAVGSFVMSVPHFTTKRYENAESVHSTLCKTNATECPTDQKSYLSKYLFVFLFGQLLHGTGGSILYTLGLAFIDDSVDSRKSPFYVGIMLAFATLGPAVGYILGGYFLNIYVDVDVISSSSVPLTTTDPRWVGAWWISFLISGSMLILVGIPMLGYPKELSAAKEVEAKRVNEAYQDENQNRLETIGTEPHIRELPRTMLLLFRNPTFMFVSLNGATEGIILSGLSTFLPKIIENQFVQTASWSAMLSGLLAVPGAAGGQLVSGIICKKMRLKVRGMLKLSLISLIFSMLCFSVLWTRCEDIRFAGITVKYSESTSSALGLKSDCNRLCHCTEENYDPVCAWDGVQYFSPCHAGCSDRRSTKNQSYSECACVSNTSASPVSGVKKGKCSVNCAQMFFFIPVMFLAIFGTFLNQTPTVSIAFRCVPDKQRSSGIGIQSFVGRIVGTLPGPLVFGYIIDKTCLVWKRGCSGDSSCWVYDGFLMSRNIFLTTLTMRFLSIVCMALAHYLYRAPSDKRVSVSTISKEDLDSATNPETMDTPL